MKVLLDSEVEHCLQNFGLCVFYAGLTMDEMQANAFLFILAGYETVATIISYTLFCLANNSECWERAQKEVDEKLGKVAQFKFKFK